MSDKKDYEKNVLRVGRLIELLKDVDQNLPVWTWGCDCLGPSDGIEIEDSKVCIGRNDYFEDINYG